MHYCIKARYSNFKQHPRDTIVTFISEEKFNTFIVQEDSLQSEPIL